MTAGAHKSFAPWGNVEYNKEEKTNVFKAECKKIPQIKSSASSLRSASSRKHSNKLSAEIQKGSHQYPRSDLSLSKANDLWFNAPAGDPALLLAGKITNGLPSRFMNHNKNNSTQRNTAEEAESSRFHWE